MKIGVFGGTFDPPHNGHMRAAAQACQALGLNRLMLIPAKVPPHKPLPADGAGQEERYHMTRLASRNLPEHQVLDLEFERPDPSYTVDTLRQLKDAYPQAELYLIMGSDMLLSFHGWKDPGEILRLATIAAFPRELDDELAACSNQEAFEEYFDNRLCILQMEPVEIASTYLRKILPMGAGLEYVDPLVADYIREKGLYRTGAPTETVDQLRAWSYPCHKASRIPHVAGCEKEAVKLAKRWGADETTARRAAILHDVTKILTHKEQLKMCERYGILTDMAEKAENKLLHAVTGSFVAEHILAESPLVADAIRWHTTGKPDMSIEAKVVFMADYIEENRNFPEVEKLRKLAYDDLNAAILYGLEITMAEVLAKGRPIHDNTLAAYAFLKGNIR